MIRCGYSNVSEYCFTYKHISKNITNEGFRMSSKPHWLKNIWNDRVKRVYKFIDVHYSFINKSIKI